MRSFFFVATLLMTWASTHAALAERVGFCLPTERRAQMTNAIRIELGEAHEPVILCDEANLADATTLAARAAERNAASFITIEFRETHVSPPTLVLFDTATGARRESVLSAAYDAIDPRVLAVSVNALLASRYDVQNTTHPQAAPELRVAETNESQAATQASNATPQAPRRRRAASTSLATLPVRLTLAFGAGFMNSTELGVSPGFAADLHASVGFLSLGLNAVFDGRGHGQLSIDALGAQLSFVWSPRLTTRVALHFSLAISDDPPNALGVSEQHFGLGGSMHLITAYALNEITELVLLVRSGIYARTEGGTMSNASATLGLALLF